MDPSLRRSDTPITTELVPNWLRILLEEELSLSTEVPHAFLTASAGVPLATPASAQVRLGFSWGALNKMK